MKQIVMNNEFEKYYFDIRDNNIILKEIYYRIYFLTGIFIMVIIYERGIFKE